MKKTVTALILAAILSAPALADPGDWSLEKKLDRFFNTGIIYRAKAQNGSLMDDDSVLLVISCSAQARLKVIFGTPPSGFLEEKTDEVSWHADRNQPLSTEAERDANGLYLLSGKEALAFAQTVRTAEERLVINFDGRRVTFGIHNASRSVGAVLDYCDL